VHILPDRIPWFIGGPGIGLLVVALYALANKHLGVSTSYLEAATFVRDRAKAETWRVCFFGGLVAGSLLAAVLHGGPRVTLDYGALGLLLPASWLVPVLFAGGLCMGYGARCAGGCTSGHGITGTSSRSPASMVAAITFMLTAVVVTAVLHGLTGGNL
jgi:uncharacterized membrane protein YedE/YeeE